METHQSNSILQLLSEPVATNLPSSEAGKPPYQGFALLPQRIDDHFLTHCVVLLVHKPALAPHASPCNSITGNAGLRLEA